MNQFTNGNKVRSQCTYDDKTKAHTEGGPPVVLLDIHTMADGLSTKMLDIIANSGSRALSKPWIPLAIEQMIMFSKNKGIFLPEHILLCNLDIKNITATSNSYDPFIIGALRDWSSMGYTRKIMSDDYEEIASLPIWLNPRLLIDGKLIKLREGTFRGIKSKTLYHIALHQL